MNGTEEELKLKTPRRMFVILAVSIFVVETVIMFLLNLLPSISSWIEQLIDSSVLTLLLFPVIYYYIFRPMTSYIADIHSARDLLQEEKAKIEAIIEGSQDAIIVMDSRGVITFWNPASVRIFGYTQEEALGRNLHELIVPERFRNDALKGLQTFRNTGRGPLIGRVVEFAGLRKNGTEFYAEHSINALKIKEEWSALGVVRDVTERKQADEVVKSLVEETQQKYKDVVALMEKLTQNEEKYRNLVNTSPNGIFVHCEGRLVFVNSAGTRILGAETPEQILGRSVMDFVHPDYIEVVKGRVKKILEQGESLPVTEEKFIRLDGTAVDVEVSASPMSYDNKPAVQGIAIDITERKKTEEALKKSRQEWESTFDAISDPIFIHDKELKVIRANEAYQQAADMPLADMAGKPYYEVFPKMEGPFSMCLKARELQEEEEEEEEEEEVFLPYLERTFLVRFYPIKDAQGRYLYSIHTMEDITERKKAEKEIMERIDELERFRKATVTREFRIKELRDENEDLKRKLGIHKV